MTRKEYINTIDVELLLLGLAKRNPFYFRTQMFKDVRYFMSKIIEALDKAYLKDAEIIIEDDKTTEMELNIGRVNYLQHLKLSGETEPPRAEDIFNMFDMQKIKLAEGDYSKIIESIDIMDDDELNDRIKSLRGIVKLIG